MKHKINIVFEQLSLQRFTVPAIIRKCIQATLDAERISVPCEINVLISWIFSRISSALNE